MDIEKAIRDYLPDVLHMSLATSANNRPWVCEVHFVYDDELNLYFRSLMSRRHSQEILQNPQVAGNIITQHGPGEKPRGVYFEGRAEHVADEASREAILSLFIKRLDADEEILDESLRPDGHQFFKITVEEFYLFDARESKPSKKYELPWQ